MMQSIESRRASKSHKEQMKEYSEDARRSGSKVHIEIEQLRRTLFFEDKEGWEVWYCEAVLCQD